MSESLEVRLGKAALTLHEAVRAFEHAVADAETVEDAQLVRATIGGCYTAFDRVNAAANSKHAHLSVRRDFVVNVND